MKYHMNARIRRSIKHNLSFYILSSILTGLVVYIIITIFSAVLMIEKDFDQICSKGNIEDAQFTTLNPISDEEISNLEETYNLQLEKIEFLDETKEEKTVRIFKETDKINRYILLEGNEANELNTIVLNRSYMEANHLSIGDYIKVQGEEYQITGMAVKPEYLYPQKESTDFYVNKEAFGIGVVSNQTFEKLKYTQNYYSVKYHGGNIDEFRIKINDSYQSLSYLSASANNRISMTTEQMEQVRIMFGALVPVFFALAVSVVAVVLGRMIKKEQKQIGTMVSFGYRKWEIVRHYIRFAAIPGIAGSLFGLTLTFLLLKQTLILYTTDYELINYHTILDWKALLIGIFVPTILNILTVIVIVLKLLKQNVVVLLTANDSHKEPRSRKLFVKTKLSFRIKYWIRSLCQNKSRTIVTLAGMFAGSFMCMLSFMIIDSCDYMIKEGMDAAGTYEYQYYLDSLQIGDPMDGEQLLAMNYEVSGNSKGFSLIGITKDPRFLKLETNSGEKIEYGKFYLTSNASKLYNVKSGEEFTIKNPLTQKETTIFISDIINDDIQCALYSSLDQVSNIIGVPDGSYNVLMSEHELSIDKDMIQKVISKEDLRKQFEYTIDLMYKMIQLFIGLGVIICIISVYITVNMLVQENGVNISMLKVLGYRTKEINRLVIHVNHILVPIAVVLSFITCKFLCEMIFAQFIDLLNIYIHPEIKMISVLLCLGILVITYILSITLVKRKVLRVHMVESLKDNRE